MSKIEDLICNERYTVKSRVKALDAYEKEFSNLTSYYRLATDGGHTQGKIPYSYRKLYKEIESHSLSVAYSKVICKW